MTKRLIALVLIALLSSSCATVGHGIRRGAEKTGDAVITGVAWCACSTVA